MKKFCGSLREHARQIINFKKKKMTLFIQPNHMPVKNTVTFIEKKLKKDADDKKIL